MDKATLAKYLDLANHHANATESDIRLVCEKVREFGFNAAFVNPYYIEFAKSFGVRVGTVVSFPLGQEILQNKITLAESAVSLGADEIDVSLNVGYVKSGDWVHSATEMKAIVEAARKVNEAVVVKFIPETGYLTPDEIKKAAELILDSGAEFFKACSGMGPRGATIEDVKLVREAIGDKLKIKVAGGIDTLEEATSFIAAGADRIGTSHAVEIVEELTLREVKENE